MNPSYQERSLLLETPPAEGKSPAGASIPGREDALIELDRIGVEFDGVKVLQELSLTVYRKDFACVLGGSGVGKTTLLRVLAGLQDISYGYVRVKNKSLRVALVAQNPTLLPWRSILSNVVTGITKDGIGKREKLDLAREKLDIVGLNDKYDMYPKELSGGMQQRVAIARALASEPDVILMDEPFSALDENLRSYLGSFLLDLWANEELTIVFNTHSIEEASVLASRALVVTRDETRTLANDLPLWSGAYQNYTARLNDSARNEYKTKIATVLSKANVLVS
jgi:NitT/TauT family transport system ATP-binding protein